MEETEAKASPKLPELELSKLESQRCCNLQGDKMTT